MSGRVWRPALQLPVRRLILYAGLTLSLSTLAFSLGSWTAQQRMALQLAQVRPRRVALDFDHLRLGERPHLLRLETPHVKKHK